nr:hypothetical protein Iba_chr14cCG12500 [Ipomoea batatas]GME10742.1 hypothetical protein Iba_scaffold10622CG0050 [Ipomoea batatas]
MEPLFQVSIVDILIHKHPENHIGAVTKQPHQILVPDTPNCFNFNLKLPLSLSPVIEQILYSNFSVVLENTTVNNAITTFTNHILIGKPIRGYFELPQSIPMAPPQVRNLRDSNGGRLIT